MAGTAEPSPSRLAITCAWPRSIAAYALLSCYVLLVGPPAILLVALAGRPALIVALGLFVVRLSRRILGLRYDIEGLEHVDGSRPVVYCMNHSSNVDVLVYEVLHRRCPRLKGLYKAELGRLPVLGRVLRAADFVPLERGNRDQTARAIERATDMLRAGDSFLIAPEGTRTHTGALLPFKRGAFVMAIAAQVPVVPVAILGGRAAMPRGSAVVRAGTLGIRVGAPIATAGLAEADRERLIASVRERIEAMTAGRPVAPPPGHPGVSPRPTEGT